MARSSKNFFKKLFGSRVFLFFIVLALIGVIIGVGQESYRKYQLAKEIKHLKSEIEKLEANSQQLSNLIEFFKDESYLEQEVRLKLNLKKPGEKVIIVPELEETGEQKSETAGQDKPAVEAEESNWWKWWQHFFQ